jgi:hypothetical protein
MTTPSTPETRVQEVSHSCATAGSVVIGHSVHGGVSPCSVNRALQNIAAPLGRLGEQLAAVGLENVEGDEMRRYLGGQLVDDTCARHHAALPRLESEPNQRRRRFEGVRNHTFGVVTAVP